MLGLRMIWGDGSFYSIVGKRITRIGVKKNTTPSCDMSNMRSARLWVKVLPITPRIKMTEDGVHVSIGHHSGLPPVVFPVFLRSEFENMGNFLHCWGGN